MTAPLAPPTRLVVRKSGFAVLLYLATVALASTVLLAERTSLGNWWVGSLLVLMWSSALVLSWLPRKFVIANGQLTIYWWWRRSRTHELRPLLPFSHDFGLWPLLGGFSMLNSADGRVRIRTWYRRLEQPDGLATALGADLDWGSADVGPRRMIFNWPGWGRRRRAGKNRGG